jgi:hypothetical protein
MSNFHKIAFQFGFGDIMWFDYSHITWFGNEGKQVSSQN